MKKLLLIILAMPFAATAAEPLATNCTHSGEMRTIEVVYPQGAELPCEVHYTKKGETRTLWTASSQAGFCESKAEELIAKQRGWGWVCDGAAASSKTSTAGESAATAESGDPVADGKAIRAEAQSD